MPRITATPAPTRRQLLTSAAAASFLPVLPRMAAAQSAGAAEALVDRVVAEVLSVINSGRSESAMIGEFEGIFARYADVPTIAVSVLGPPARSASQAQLRAFTEAFRGYMARKYGRRFRDFIGGQIVVTGSRPVRSFIEVISTVNLRGEAPFEVRWLVSDGSGQILFFNIIIEGVNLMISERTEIGALLEAQRGNIDGLIAALRQAG